jgi:NADH-ubiquinone oxidoreductase chain 4
MFFFFLISQLLLFLLLIPLIGIFIITLYTTYGQTIAFLPNTRIKLIGLVTSIINLIISLIIFILFDFSSKQFQFIQEHHQISYFDIYLGVDGLSIYFVLLTTIIMPLALLSN